MLKQNSSLGLANMQHDTQNKVTCWR